MLRLTQAINSQGVSRFMFSMCVGIKPERVSQLEAGATPYHSEVSRLGAFLGTQGLKLFEEVEEDELERNQGKTEGTLPA
jgi:ribosome-binding protein aMBF1 (putative translation factor)